ncbi:hypothetical protein ACFL2V_05915 [Pseudomonadota bacterium]
MTCDSLERRRALLEKKVVCQNGVTGPRPLITDRELVEQLLRLEREMERGSGCTPRYASVR